jgi:N6-adenosine-specific RNA methylase IME4
MKMGMKPRARFRFFLADPPWRMRDQGTRMAPGYAGGQRATAHYEPMSLEEICGLRDRIHPHLAESCILGLWCPHALVLDGWAARVATEWGFRVPVQELIWAKTTGDGSRTRYGGGHYFRVATEPMVIAARGQASELVKRHDVANIFRAPRTSHSRKPDRSYEIIEEVFRGPYLELFARRRYSGRWRIWGDQAPPEGFFPL